MLSIIHKKVYLEFLNLLEDFQEQLNGSDQSIAQRGWYNLQQFSQEKLLPLTEDGLAESIVQQWRSLQTEIQRELRLLNTDILFLAAARQTKTKELKLQSISDRLTKLSRFSNIAKDLIEGIENRA